MVRGQILVNDIFQVAVNVLWSSYLPYMWVTFKASQNIERKVRIANILRQAFGALLLKCSVECGMYDYLHFTLCGTPE